MIKEIAELLVNPPADARGYTRWWWYGCAVTEEGIEKQLNTMKEAGIGGVEIQIIYPLSQDDAEKGIKNIPYFSPDFFDILDFTARKCAELDMKLDFTLGSSWPYGGPFVPKRLAMQCAIPYQVDVRGPCEYHCDLTTRIVGEVCAAVMGKMENSAMVAETMVDITDKFTVKYLFNWPWGTQIEPLKIPEGNWKIVFFVIHGYRQTVRIPAPNTEGYVIDHCSREAADCFFENMAQPLVDRIGAGAVNSFFCDSIECDGHNWSGVLLEEFHKRRGYDLKPYIYALWGDSGDITPYVRYDYFLTMSDLTIENFFERFTGWCNENGSLSRTQVHGTWGDVLRAYATADIPEGETFGQHITLGCNTIHRRLAASAGHLYGKNIISNETFTWLRTPRFCVTPEDMKAAVDAVFLDGMNMIVNHGFPYSPETIPGAGWPFYASSHICDRNPWWPWYRHLAKYIQSVSAVLRRGRHFAEVGIYLPQADVWSDNVLSDIHLAMRLEEHIGREVADAVNKAGYWFDYINDDALDRLGQICDGGIQLGSNVYKAILLIGCTRLPERTAGVLNAFVNNGGTLIAALSVPHSGCGLMDYEKKDRYVEETISRLFKEEGWNTIGLGRTRFIRDKGSPMIDALKEAISPDVCVDHPDTVGYIHRIDGDCHIYFTANISPKACRCSLTFKNQTSGFRLINPETGEERKAVAFHENSGNMTLVIEYAPYESMLVLFSPQEDLRDVTCDEGSVILSALKLKDWTLRIPSLSMEKKMEDLTGWEGFEETAWYSGEGIYECSFICTGDMLEYQSVVLALGKVSCAAAVEVNGIDCGDIWKAPYEMEIRQALKEGENQISIRVANTLINEAIKPEYTESLNPVVIEGWPYFGNVINEIRQYRLYNEKERTQVLSPVPSGLSGSGTLLFY